MSDIEADGDATALKDKSRMTEDSSEGEGEFGDDGSGSDSDFDGNIALPEDLIGISSKEKKELYRFKQQHTEMEFEAEMMRRIDTLQGKKDLERLKKMQVGAKKDAPPAAAKRASKPRATKTTKEKAPRAVAAKKAKVVLDEEEEDEFDDADEEESDDDDELYESSDDDDDLFDNDEIEAAVNDSKLGSGGRLTKGLAGKVAGDGEDEGGMSMSDPDDDDEEDEEESRKRKRGGAKSTKKSTAASKKSSNVSKKRTPSKKSRLNDITSDNDEDGDEADRLEGYSDDEYGGDVAETAKERERRKAEAARKKFFGPSEEEDTSGPAELEDYQRLQTRREYVEKWLREPYFEDVVKGSYVRFHVGQMNGQAVYRMAVVLDIQDAKRPYKMPGTEIMADKTLLLGVGKSEKLGRLEKVSNSRITPAEFAQYASTLRDCRMEDSLLTKKQADKRRQWVKERLQHVYTHEEIAAIIARNESKNKALTTTYGHAIDTLQKKLTAARNNEDFESMEQLQKDIDKLQREVHVNKEMYSKNYGSFTDINKRNKKENLKLDMEAGIRRKKMDTTASLSKNLEDPFARRDTRPKVLWVTGAKKAALENAAGPGEGGEEESKSSARDVTSAQDAEDTEDTIASKIISKANKSKFTLSMSSDEGFVTDPEELGRRIEAKFGFANPWKSHQISQADRYLKTACENLPPLGSGDREDVRAGMSLSKYQESSIY